MFKVIVDNKEFQFEEKITLVELAKQLNKEAYVAVVNKRLRELNFYLNFNCEVEFLDLNNFEAVKVYETSLRYLIIMAIENLYPNAKVNFTQCVSRSIACTVNGLGVRIDNKFLNQLESEMRRLVELDLPIERESISKDEAIRIYTEKGYLDKVEVLKYRDEETSHIYKCGNYVNYLFGYMVPSTGCLKYFNLNLYHPGFTVQFPRAEEKGEIPTFEVSTSFGKMLNDAKKWANTCECTNIPDLNKYATSANLVDLVTMCETKHNNMLAELGEIIKSDIENIRLICIAGPSSSGKTTFSNRLRIELMSKGIKPVKISMDDYYLERKYAPKDIDGKPDLEHVGALDLDLFNEHLLALIEGQEVQLPVFNFQTGKREWGEKFKVDPKSPIIIEGIHALNEAVSKLIPKHQKFKIYISPTQVVNIDNHNPISSTEIRLLRRVVRDLQFRKTSPSQTFSMWPSVRRGEFKWIYPFQEDADYIFNTELSYELCVMKKYAMAALSTLTKDDEYYIQANRLIKFLKYIKDIDDKYVPCNSLLREFIGGSCFYE